MDNKYLMENILYASKVLNDLYLHGVIESSNEKISLLFNKVIHETLKMHNEIYKAMEEVGIYTITNVNESKIEQTKSKLECNCSECDCEEE